MKSKKILHGTFIGLLVFMLFGCAGAPSSSANSAAVGMDLDAAIREAAAQMEARIPAETMVALVSMASSSAQFSEYVISRLEAALVSGRKLIVVDRANLDRIREEQGFQLSDDVDDNSAKAIGKFLGAGAIVTGAFVNLGDVYSLTLKAINIETATVAVSYPADIARSTRIETLLASGGGAARTQTAQRGNTGGNTTVQAPATPAPAVPPTPIYKIGDNGPAGGLIFYDKGNNSGGWRYLEAAPAETERIGSMYGPSMYGGELLGSRRVGDGKENTNKFITEFQRNGGGINTAPWLCSELVVNGFDDWYLPSADELLYMYNNLYLKGLSDLKNGVYWSSTVIRATWNFLHCIDFVDGSEKKLLCGVGDSGITGKNQVRAIRRF